VARPTEREALLFSACGLSWKRFWLGCFYRNEFFTSCAVTKCHWWQASTGRSRHPVWPAQDHSIFFFRFCLHPIPPPHFTTILIIVRHGSPKRRTRACILVSVIEFQVMRPETGETLGNDPETWCTTKSPEVLPETETRHDSRRANRGRSTRLGYAILTFKRFVWPVTSYSVERPARAHGISCWISKTGTAGPSNIRERNTGSNRGAPAVVKGTITQLSCRYESVALTAVGCRGCNNATERDDEAFAGSNATRYAKTTALQTA